MTAYADARARIRGLVLNQLTPYKKVTLEVDHEGLRGNIEYWMQNKVPVIMITEICSLSEREVYDLTRTTVEAVAGRAFVIASTGFWWQGQSIAFAKECKKLGADALIVLKYDPPGMPEAAYLFHKAIADACDIPLIYHSAQVGPKSIEVIQRVAEIPSVIGMKQETDNYPQMSLLRDSVGDKWAVICPGGSELAFWAHICGAAGSLTGIGQWAPAAEVEFVEDLLAHRYDKAMQHLLRVTPFRRKAFASQKRVMVIKLGMDLAGLAGGPARPLETIDLNEKERAEMTEAIYATGLLKRN